MAGPMPVARSLFFALDYRPDCVSGCFFPNHWILNTHVGSETKDPRLLGDLEGESRPDMVISVVDATSLERHLPTILVHLGDGDVGHDASDLHVAYVLPAAVWRVSYRLVIDKEDDCALMAWAIIHNPIDEDIDHVELTLTTGQPVSFEIDLYGMKKVKRAVVEEKSTKKSKPCSEG